MKIFDGRFIQGAMRGVVVAVLLGFIGPGNAAGSQYILDWHTMDGGGSTSSGGRYALTGTIGQPDAAYSVGGRYELLGGFWPGGPLCIVNFDDFAIFAEWWLEPNCSEENNWCSGADLNHSDGVDILDLSLLVDEWLCCCPIGWPLK